MKKTVVISAPEFYGIDNDIEEAFEAVGFKTFLINDRSTKISLFERIANRVGMKLSWSKPLRNLILKLYLEKENREFISYVNKQQPDLIFIVKGDFIFPSTLNKLKQVISCPIVAYAWDDPFHSGKNDYTDNYRKVNFKNGIPLYNMIFVFDSFYVDEIRRHEGKDVRYLPLATNPKTFSSIVLTEQDKVAYGYDVCFVGMPFPNRIDLFNDLNRYGYNVGVFGDHWTKAFMIRGQKAPSYYKGKATGKTVNKIYMSSKIALNIHHPHSIEGLNTRTFDIPACGAFEIVDYKKSLAEHFEIDKEIVAFEDVNKLKSKIDFYLKNTALRKAISENGKKRVLNEHTWVHRVSDVITALRETGYPL